MGKMSVNTLRKTKLQKSKFQYKSLKRSECFRQKNKRQVNNSVNINSVTQSMDCCTKSVMRRNSFDKMYIKYTLFLNKVSKWKIRYDFKIFFQLS